MSIYLIMFSSVMASVMFCVFMILHDRQKELRKDTDRKVQALLDEMAWSEFEYRRHHPEPNSAKIINVDFTTHDPIDPVDTVLGFKLVYDEELGIYYKVPR